LKPEQHHPKNNQGKPVNLTELHEYSDESLLAIRREHFVTYNGFSGCGRSTPEEMCEEHHDTDYQQHVNYATGNVKRQESKQPKDLH
jgi:hypothetical protein